MKPLIINVRGNSGSGKTFLTREFMSYADEFTSGDDQLLIYKKRRWAVLGSYSNVCGGCDTIRTQQEIINRIQFCVLHGYNVWLEGLLISGMYGSLGRFSEQFGDRWVFAFLDTPLNKCLKRVKSRRVSAGNHKPFNPANTVNRHVTIIRTRQRLLEMKRRVIDLPHGDPLTPLLEIILKEGR